MSEPAGAKIAAALVAALAELTVVDKGRTAKIPTKDNKSYSYSFADISDVVRCTRPVLAEQGLVALTPIHDHGDGLACTVTLLHTSGERLDLGPFPFPHGVDARATGSMVTYHRRYALIAALGMAAGDEDDDGAEAAPRGVPVDVPGYRTSLIGAMNKLSAAESKTVRAWCKEQGLPQNPAQMDADQADRVTDYILHGLPKGEA